MSKLSFVKYPFAKYQGTGNDFILIDDRSLSFSHPIRTLCDRKFGIGADGVILLQPDSDADFRMRIFNSDGSEAESCGNGLRCLLRFLTDLNLPQKPYRIKTGNRIVLGEFFGEQIAVQMGEPQDLRLHLQTDLHFVDTGVPHTVLFVPDTAKYDLQTHGPILRRHPLFQPRGTNINIASQNSDGSFSVRTFERGVEAEVLACGTGATAVAAIAHALHLTGGPVTIRFAGGEIEVQFTPDGLTMIGPAKRVFQGTFSLLK